MSKRRSEGDFCNSANTNPSRRMVPLLLDVDDVARVDAYVDRWNENRVEPAPRMSRALVVRMAMKDFILKHKL